ncbi:MAG: Na/Pi cotransporter family protein [Candidatus Theseobacter exili]|nr:Na/Pi cotransporter family protein [Candidatus Theseobacter exili]
MDLNVILQMIFNTAGGLGLFLLGMKNMSEGMQAVAGNRLRKLISAVTNNRLIACGVGAFVTCLIQSSSVTTVMLVGFVNAGLMTLTQSIGVILGADIGTTITGWILALNIGKYGLPLLGISAIIFLFSSKEKLRYTAMLFLGLGMVFFGLELMKNGFRPLRNAPEFITWFSKFNPATFMGLIKCVLVGASVTAIIQSSSATIGITMGLAATGVIDFRTAAALVLGQNVGTTITAYISSLGTSTNAKRTAYAHIIIKIAGVCIIVPVFGWYIELVGDFLGVDPGMCVVEDGVNKYPYVLRGIAFAHTGFNIFIAAIFLPFITYLGKMLYRFFPDKAEKEKPHLTFLDIRMYDAPAIGIQQSWSEVVRMSEGVQKMLSWIKNIIVAEDRDEALEKKIFHREEVLDIVQKEILVFLSNILSGTVPHEVMVEGRKQIRMADEYETISDYIVNILKLSLKINKEKLKISDEGKEEIMKLHENVSSYIDMVNESVIQKNPMLSKARTQGDAITHLMKECRSKHLSRVEEKRISPQKSLIFTDMLNSYRRIKDHALNIAEVLAGEK